MVTKKLSQATLSGKSVGASKPREVRDIPAANINVAEDKPGETTKLIKKESMETVCGAGFYFFGMSLAHVGECQLECLQNVLQRLWIHSLFAYRDFLLVDLQCAEYVCFNLQSPPLF